MKKKFADNLSKYFYDCGKIAFAVLVIGVIARRPLNWVDLSMGALTSLTLVAIGATLDLFPTKGD